MAPIVCRSPVEIEFAYLEQDVANYREFLRYDHNPFAFSARENAQFAEERRAAKANLAKALARMETLTCPEA